MRAQAKRSSAANREGSALGGSVYGSREDASRASSASAKGIGAPSRRSARLAIGLIIAVVALLAVAPSAIANVLTRAQTIPSFGPDGTTATSFAFPYSLDFNQAADRLYVEDPLATKLHAFDTPAIAPSGGAFPIAVVSNFAGIGIDNTLPPSPSAGNIYVVELSTDKLHGFKADGTPLGGAFPISLPPAGQPSDVAVDSTGTIFVSDATQKLFRRFSPAGASLGTIAGPGLGPGHLAFDSNDDLFFTVSPIGGTVGTYKLTASSGYSPASLITITSGFSPAGIAVDATTHTLYVANSTSVSAYSATTGSHLYDFAYGIPNESLRGIAVDEGTDTVYLGDTPGGANNVGKIHVFGPAQNYADATATLAAAKNITDTTAEIGATIADNNVLPTAWRLELSSDGGTIWNSKASGQTSGRSATVASTGFSVGTLTVKASGGTFKLTFEGKTTPALAHNASASAVQAALEALSTIGAGNVEVSGGPGSPSGATPYSIIFTGTLAGTSVAKISANPLGLVNPSETVSHTLTGLNPNSSYKFRLITNKGQTAATQVISTPLTFKTVAPPPVIEDVGAVQVTDTSARLVATIDPRNTETGYAFEYGTTPALGSSTPPLNIGGGTSPITVSQVIGGLTPDTTYYFRAVATNLTGTTQSPSATTHTRATPLPLPADRGYEQVTPVDKNYGSVDAMVIGLNPVVDIALNGAAVGYCTSNRFGEPPNPMGATCAPYISRRTPEGWQTPTDVFPEYCHVDPDSGNEGGVLGIRPSADYSRVLFKKPESAGCPISTLDPNAPISTDPEFPAYNLYLQSPFGDPISYQLLNLQYDFNPASTFGSRVSGGSDDFSTIVYESTVNQTTPPDSPDEGEFTKIYEWDEGELRLVSKDPSDEPFETKSFIPVEGTIEGGNLHDFSAVSEDGERIYFVNLTGPSANSVFCGPPCALYMREGGATTHHVSASECSLACGDPQANSPYFLAATPSGEKAFFTSCAKLTDESSPPQSCIGGQPWSESNAANLGTKLYRWDRSAPPGNRLLDLTIDSEPFDGSQPDFYGLLGASEDGDTAYFVTRSQIVSGEPTFASAITGTEQDLSGGKIYRWRYNGGNPSIDYIGPYQGLSPSGNDYNLLQQHRQVSADGNFLSVYTRGAFDPAADRDSDADVYRWDEENEWLCVSCQLPGAPSRGDIDLSRLKGFGDIGSFFQEIATTEPTTYMSRDGQRIFFGTPDALVPEDVNGEVGCPLDNSTVLALEVNVYVCEDVYEWHDGKVNLISSGTGAEPARLIGSDLTGEDVFFFTRQRLVGWDIDDGVDIYDARIGGGFPEPPPQPPTCEGEACRGTGTSAPTMTGAGTPAFQGPGNPKAQPEQKGCPKGKRQVRRKGKTRCVAKAGKHRGKRVQRRAANNNRRTGR